MVCGSPAAVFAEWEESLCVNPAMLFDESCNKSQDGLLVTQW